MPILEGARPLAEAGVVPGGTRRNFDAVAELVRWGEGVDETTRLLLCDAQTSGGLLIAVEPARCDDLVAQLRSAPTLAAAVIGEVTDQRGTIVVETE